MNYFSNICRICMLKDIKLINIYHSDDDMITYIDKLNTCIPEIFTADNYIPLPDQICELCCKNLKIVFWFRELCLKSNSVLRSYHVQLNDGIKINGESHQNKECAKEEPANKTHNNIRIKDENNCTEYIDNNENIAHNSESYAEERKPLESENYLAVKIKSENSDSDDNEEISQYANVELNTLNESQSTKKNTQETANEKSDSNKNDETKPTDLTPIPEIVQQPFALEVALEEDASVDLEPDPEPDPEISPLSAEQQKKLRHLCSFCGKAFKYRQDMRVHERMHTGHKPYKCQYCPKTFAKSTRLKLHVNTHTREKTFTCKICDKKFNQSSNLGVHMKLHTQTERFACHLCEKTFSQKRHLKQHILFHENERRFTCEICNWSFGMKHHLKRHMMTHTGQRPPKKDLPAERERPYSCDQCDWSFMSKEVLKKHLLMHTRDNPKLRASLNDEKRRFPCSKCIWSFTKKHHLERHMVKHENRKFSCSACDQEFRKNYELQRHVKTVHCDLMLQGNETS